MPFQLTQCNERGDFLELHGGYSARTVRNAGHAASSRTTSTDSARRRRCPGLTARSFLWRRIPAEETVGVARFGLATLVPRGVPRLPPFVGMPLRPARNTLRCDF